MQNLLEELPAALERKGISQSELARVTGIDRTLINRYCNGLRPTEANAAKLREVLVPMRDGVAA